MVSEALLHNILLCFCVLSEYPLGIISRKLHNILLRKIFHLLAGLVICYIIYKLEFLLVAAGLLCVWVTLHFPGNLRLVTIIIPISGIFWIHMKRLGKIGDWRSDISGLIMFSSLRTILLTFNIFDGKKKVVKRKQWENMKLEYVPNIFDFFVYMFSFTGTFSGPLLPFNIFIKTLELKADEKEEKEDMINGLKAYGLTFIYSICSAVTVFLFPTKMIISDPFYEKPYLIQIVLSVLYSLFHTTRYMFAWTGCEAALKAQGATRFPELFDPEYCRSFRPEVYFTQRNMGGLVNEWNHSVHFFLKECIHTRVLAIGGGQLLARMLTFLFSAFWHGFYPGYYIYAFAVMTNGIIDGYRMKLTTPLLTKLFGQKFTVVFDCVYTQFNNYYQGATWDLLWAEPVLSFFRRTKCGPFIFEICLIFVGYLYRMFGPRPPRAQKKPEEKKDDEKKDDKEEKEADKEEKKEDNEEKQKTD